MSKYFKNTHVYHLQEGTSKSTKCGMRITEFSWIEPVIKFKDILKVSSQSCCKTCSKSIH